jgi:hypothetical protein
MTKNYLLLVLLLTLLGCKVNPISTESAEQAISLKYGPNATVIQGLLVSKEMDKAYSNDDSHPCGEFPCLGNIVIQSIVQRGMNFHGQFTVGDTMFAQFTYTLGSSGKYFPQKNPAPNDIPLGSVIECIVTSKPEGSFIVQDHKTIKHD